MKQKNGPFMDLVLVQKMGNKLMSWFIECFYSLNWKTIQGKYVFIYSILIFLIVITIKMPSAADSSMISHVQLMLIYFLSFRKPFKNIRHVLSTVAMTVNHHKFTSFINTALSPRGNQKDEWLNQIKYVDTMWVHKFKMLSILKNGMNGRMEYWYNGGGRGVRKHFDMWVKN